MKYIFKNQNTFFCFSPPVMLATFATEIALAGYVLVRYKMTALTRVVTAQLVLLAAFQLAEYQVCGRAADIWPRVGFAAVSLLPVAGLAQVYVLAKRRFDFMMGTAVGTGLVMVAGFVFLPAISGTTCTSNYAMFYSGNLLATWTYTLYYFGWLLAGMTLAARHAARAAKRVKWALHLQIIGYSLFIVPTAFAVTLHPKVMAGVPSIMCGFAVLYALIITLGIIPAVQRKK